jgi:hypothetical protein
MASAIANSMLTKLYLRGRLECPSVNQLRCATGCSELTSKSVVRHKLHFEGNQLQHVTFSTGVAFFPAFATTTAFSAAF